MATLGQQLKAARQAKGISETEAGAATRTLTRVIVAMEADDFSGMAAPAYSKGFIRLYARYLGLNPDPLIAEYMAKYAPGAKPLVDEESQLEQNRRPSKAFTMGLKWRLPKKLNPLTWMNVPVKKITSHLKPYVLQDIRAVAIGAAALLVLIILAVSVTNCVRRHTATKPAQPPAETSSRKLLDRKLPDLYLIEPNKIESSR